MIWFLENDDEEEDGDERRKRLMRSKDEIKEEGDELLNFGP